MFKQSPTCWYKAEKLSELDLFVRNLNDYHPIRDDSSRIINKDRLYFSVFKTDIERPFAILKYPKDELKGVYFLFDKGSPFERYLLRKGIGKKVEPYKARTLDLISDIKSDHNHDAGIEPVHLPEFEDKWYEIENTDVWNKAFRKIWNNDFQVTRISGHVDIFFSKDEGAGSAWYNLEEINGEHAFYFIKIVKTNSDKVSQIVKFTQDSPFKQEVLNGLVEVNNEQKIDLFNHIYRTPR